MPRMQFFLLLTLFATGFGGCQIGSNLFFTFTGMPFRITRIGRLHDPRRVVGVDSDDLLLEGNQRVHLPGLASFRSHSQPVLERFLERGVEVSPDGRVHGLIAIHHWCGNDPVGREIARVDLGEVLAFFRQGGLYWELCQKDASHDVCHDYPGFFSSTGWMTGEYQDFLRWREQPPRKPPSSATGATSASSPPGLGTAGGAGS